jgi:hypothetical protein
LDALYSVIRELAMENPGALYNFELVAAGFAPGMAAQMGIERWVTELGKLPHRDALTLMRTADALFASVPLHLNYAIASKLFEYLAADRPILLVSHPDGESARLINRTGGGIVTPPDNPGQLKALVASLGRAKTFEIPAKNPEQIAALTRRALTAQLADLLDTAASAAGQIPIMAPSRNRRETKALSLPSQTIKQEN